MNTSISIRGARQHNLQSIDLDLPVGAMIALCGPSGSGKSSLAFDTLFAESRRRFLDCLSSQIRKSLEQPDKPDVDSITGLPPSLCLEQTPSAGAGGTLLGSTTEILDYLRVLYAAAGIPHDPKTGVELIRQTPDQIVSALLDSPENSKITLLAPVSPLLLSDIAAALGDFQRQGFLRLRWNDEIVDIDDLQKNLPADAPTHAALVIDRIILKKESSSARLADSVQTSLRINEEEIQALIQPPNAHHPATISFHTRFRNPETGFTLPQLTPRHFSFHSPMGACPDCKGSGSAISGKTRPCPSCGGKRLNPLALSVTIAWEGKEYNIADLIALPLSDFLSLADKAEIPAHLEPACSRLTAELSKRLYFLDSLGLGYLSLNRTTTSLSGGEIQRARLASQLGGGLSGVLYILDEPTIGLHPSDTSRLIDSLRRLRDMGNTILIVEHDEQVLSAADYIVDMGPGSGIHGGNVLAQGTLDEIKANTDSITGAWLSGRKSMPAFPSLPIKETSYLTLHHAKAHNLDNVTLRIPLGTLTSISGPSGSGKSSLINDCLIPALKAPLPSTLLEGRDKISRFVLIDQSPIGKSPRSTPATATGLLDILRPLYAKLPLSRQRGYTSSRFSTNTRGGRCERCMGTGVIEIDMHFLSNVTVPCDACGGQRYNRETLEVTWRGKSIAQALALTVDEAAPFFSPIPKAAAILGRMQETGLGYLTLDRASSTLSGGEAQRIKISAELAKIPNVNLRERPGTPPSLFILDEPTTGLHFEETARLLQAISNLRAAGNTILCIEHNIDILLASDHLIDMGPGAGSQGGHIVAEGSPFQLADNQSSPTGRWLSLKYNK